MARWWSVVNVQHTHDDACRSPRVSVPPSVAFTTLSRSQVACLIAHIALIGVRTHRMAMMAGGASNDALVLVEIMAGPALFSRLPSPRMLPCSVAYLQCGTACLGYAHKCVCTTSRARRTRTHFLWPTRRSLLAVARTHANQCVTYSQIHAHH